MADLIGEQFILASADSYDFGRIDDSLAAELGISAGPIRLQQGYEAAFGNRHVESHAQRMKQIRGLGFATFAGFCAEVAVNFHKVCRGENGRLILVGSRLGRDLCVVIEYKNDGYWTVITGLPKVARYEVLKELKREGGSEPSPDIAEKRPRLATLSLPKKA